MRTPRPTMPLPAVQVGDAGAWRISAGMRRGVQAGVPAGLEPPGGKRRACVVKCPEKGWAMARPGPECSAAPETVSTEEPLAASN